MLKVRISVKRRVAITWLSKYQHDILERSQMTSHSQQLIRRIRADSISVNGCNRFSGSGKQI